MMRLLKRLRVSQSGTAMIEFAIAAPVMAALFFGTIEVTQSLIAKRRLNLLVSTMADLTARSKSVSSSDIDAIFAASGAVMAPVATTGMQMRISSLIVSSSGTGCIDWSVGQNMTALSAGSAFTVPASLLTPPASGTRSYIMAEATIPFRPITHYLVTSTVTLKEGPTYLVPRLADRVPADSSVRAQASPCA